MKRDICLVLALFLFLLPSQSYAYLDPGSGSFIIQVVVAGLVGGSLFFKNIAGKISSIFGKKKSSEDDEQETNE